MLQAPQFTIEKVEEGRNYGRFQVEPLDPGYGTTLGNSLRRILLRSLEGCAVSRIRLDNVWHEFATIPGVREDVTEIVLNLKSVRLRQITELHGDVRGRLFVTQEKDGERVITAGDIQWPVEVELVNPDQHIATLSEKGASIDMDLWITRGRGYVPAELQTTGQLGEIPIDSIFTPIQRVNYIIEQTRVGSEVDHDRLIMEILTDGTVDPEDALSFAAQILMAHARVFAEFTEPTPLESAENMIPEEVQNQPLAELGITARVLNALRGKQIETVGQVLTIDPDQLLSIRGVGPKAITELRDRLAEFGYLPTATDDSASAVTTDNEEGAEESADEEA